MLEQQVSVGWDAALSSLLSPIAEGKFSLQFLWFLSLIRCYLPVVYISFSIFSNLLPQPEKILPTFNFRDNKPKTYTSAVNDRKVDGELNLFKMFLTNFIKITIHI